MWRGWLCGEAGSVVSDYVLECVCMCVCSFCSFFCAIARDVTHVRLFELLRTLFIPLLLFFLSRSFTRCCDVFDSFCIFARSRALWYTCFPFFLYARACVCLLFPYYF